MHRKGGVLLYPFQQLALWCDNIELIYVLLRVVLPNHVVDINLMLYNVCHFITKYRTIEYYLPLQTSQIVQLAITKVHFILMNCELMFTIATITIIT